MEYKVNMASKEEEGRGRKMKDRGNEKSTDFHSGPSNCCGWIEC